MAVSREQLEASLEKVHARTRSSREGLYGPSSMIWRVNREQLLFVSGARAVLLQEAHPYVAHGYRQGASYEANDERALLWVHATIWESSIMAFELIFHPLSADEKERYYQETKLFGYMFGIPDEILPPTWPDFLAYNERMWDSSDLAVGNTAREMAEFILSPTNHFHARFGALIPAMAAGMLPPRFREAYGLAFGPRERAIYQASVHALRAGWRLLPRYQRFVPAYLDARSRIGAPIVPTLPERIFHRLYPPRLPGASAS